MNEALVAYKILVNNMKVQLTHFKSTLFVDVIIDMQMHQFLDNNY
jgi:hypothetical protein